jgi:predicted nucleic acid-binding protein
MDAKIEYHIKEHVEVLSQYLTSNNTDKPKLGGMVVRILIKFFKRAYLEYALDIWFEKENLQPADKIGVKLLRLRSLLERKFDIELVDIIIADIVKHYKIKLTK